jgi:hypothetical protein
LKGKKAFLECYSLSVVTFAGNSKLEWIGFEAFSKYSKLAEIDIPDTLISLGDAAFTQCTQLKVVNFRLGCNVMNFSFPAFVGCPLESLVVPHLVDHLDFEWF